MRVEEDDGEKLKEGRRWGKRREIKGGSGAVCERDDATRRRVVEVRSVDAMGYETERKLNTRGRQQMQYTVVEGGNSGGSAESQGTSPSAWVLASSCGHKVGSQESGQRRTSGFF